MYRHRYQDADIYTYRQLLGDISKQEIKDINTVFGGSNGLVFTKGVKDPALIYAWNTIPLAIYWGLGAGIAVYALGVKRYNILWTVAPFAPLWALMFYQYVRQPSQTIENAYKYLLAKRAATCEYESNLKRFKEASFANS